MPELPEVETVVRGLARALTGARIEHIDVRRQDLRFPLPKKLADRVKGRIVETVTRRAKYILINLDSGDVLILHLGMSGRLVIADDPAAPQKHDHLIFHLHTGSRLVFNDPRRFGLCDLVPKDGLETHKLLRDLGVEPLAGDLDEAYLTRILKDRKTPIKAILLDQRFIVGIGNIYASEILFKARIDPSRPAGSLEKAEIKKLLPSIKAILTRAIAAGGSSLRDYVQSNGELGNFQQSFAVYGREGKSCPNCICEGNRIRKTVQAGRSTFRCPVRQK